ncbi:hypothetical protein M8494_37460 [Serratia ureilytica]
MLQPEAGNAAHAVVWHLRPPRQRAAQPTKRTSSPSLRRSPKVRHQQGTTGPCYVGKDTYALSERLFISVLEVLTANGVV